MAASFHSTPALLPPPSLRQKTREATPPGIGITASIKATYHKTNRVVSIEWSVQTGSHKWSSAATVTALATLNGSLRQVDRSNIVAGMWLDKAPATCRLNLRSVARFWVLLVSGCCSFLGAARFWVLLVSGCCSFLGAVHLCVLLVFECCSFLLTAFSECCSLLGPVPFSGCRRGGLEGHVQHTNETCCLLI